MKLFVILIIFVLKTVLAEGLPTFVEDLSGIESRIFKGEFATPGQFPWQAYLSIEQKNGNLFQCGGALICNSWVLTAAHCIRSASYITVYLGSVNRSQTVETGRVEVSVKRMISHGLYFPSFTGYDIALVQLKHTVNYTNNIQAIPLNSDEIGANVSVTVGGWGRINQDGFISHRLKFIQLNTISYEKCKSYNYPIGRDAICCINKDKKNVCEGDSGGPLVMKKRNGKFIHVGIACATSFNCENGNPSIYIRTDAHLAWIKQQIGNTCQLPRA